MIEFLAAVVVRICLYPSMELSEWLHECVSKTVFLLLFSISRNHDKHIHIGHNAERIWTMRRINCCVYLICQRHRHTHTPWICLQTARMMMVPHLDMGRVSRIFRAQEMSQISPHKSATLSIWVVESACCKIKRYECVCVCSDEENDTVEIVHILLISYSLI